ncbi:MAG: nucleotide exchange factor GrpE [Sulfurospirillaceae bacterium]|nr:nucleotide exchange factor GrpE [Sulfurospirillaceae bacterium]MDD3462940.1 nucleotide exchange factor GrpE [Sulfurospirillaceae bacterium]
MSKEKAKEKEKIETEVEQEVCSTEESAVEVEGLIEQESQEDILKAKIAELEDKYLRASADFDNIKRRLEKEKIQAVSYAHEVFARDLLPVIDALEIAMVSGENQELDSSDLLNKVKEGIGLTVEQFRKTFEKHGIVLVDTNMEFDPNFHEAIMQMESEGKSTGEILQVFQKGYKIKDRVLRPAMVSIAK